MTAKVWTAFHALCFQCWALDLTYRFVASPGLAAGTPSFWFAFVILPYSLANKAWGAAVDVFAV